MRELISVEEVMEKLEYGPNGALIYCMEHLIKNLDWLEEQVGDYDDDYLIIDCPGQIELYTHFSYFKTITKRLQKLDYRICCVSLIDSHFLIDSSLFISATLMCLSVMINLELPHINVITKMDIYERDNADWLKKEEEEVEYNELEK